MIKTDTRTKNSTRNIIFSMLAYMIQMVLGFLARRYFIFYFNSEYLGLNSLFSNILSLLSLAELGFGSALVFAMYKPMAEGDEEKVRQLLYFYKKCYFTIGCIIGAVGLLVLPFIRFLDAPKVDVNLYVVYLIFLFNSIISYFFAHRRSLLYTNQRNDIESKTNMILNILLTTLQLAVVCLLKNYYIYILLTGIIAIINNLFIFAITQKMFPHLVTRPSSKLDKESVQAIKKNVKAMIYHKIGSVVIYGTDSLLIALMFDLNSLGNYSNYLLITSSISSFIAIFTGAIRGSVGNSIASESVEKNYDLLRKLNYIYFAIISFCTVCIFVLSDPFISIVLTKDSSQNLLFNKSIIIALCINFYLSQSRYLTGMFKECAGIFHQDRYKSIIESIINLVASVLLAKAFGLIGIILGTITSCVLMPLWVEPYVLNKHYMHKSTAKYFVKYLLYTLCMLVSGAVTVFACTFIPDSSIWFLILKFGVCAVVAGVSLLVTMMPFKEFKECLSWGKNILANFKHKKKNVESVDAE